MNGWGAFVLARCAADAPIPCQRSEERTSRPAAAEIRSWGPLMGSESLNSKGVPRSWGPRWVRVLELQGRPAFMGSVHGVRVLELQERPAFDRRSRTLTP
jgi:hypothetical protein